MKLGTIQLRPGAALAPMAGFTDAAQRRMAARFGASFTVSEMVSAKALTLGDKKSPKLIENGENCAPYGVQLFGAEPETMAEAARLIDESRVSTDEVQILNKVKIKNTKNNAVMTYTLVSDSEANLKEGKIAVSTPIAQGLMGKKVGDVVEIRVPSGVMTFEIMDISI